MTSTAFSEYEFVERPANPAGLFSIVAYVKSATPKKGPQASLNARVAAGVNLRETADKVVLESIATQPGHRLKGLARELHRRAVELAHKRGKRLIGTERRKAKLNEVWDKLRDQRLAMEKAGYDGNIQASSAPEAPKGDNGEAPAVES